MTTFFFLHIHVVCVFRFQISLQSDSNGIFDLHICLVSLHSIFRHITESGEMVMYFGRKLNKLIVCEKKNSYFDIQLSVTRSLNPWAKTTDNNKLRSLFATKCFAFYPIISIEFLSIQDNKSKRETKKGRKWFLNIDILCVAQRMNHAIYRMCEIIFILFGFPTCSDRRSFRKLTNAMCHVQK